MRTVIFVPTFFQLVGDPNLGIVRILIWARTIESFALADEALESAYKFLSGSLRCSSIWKTGLDVHEKQPFCRVRNPPGHAHHVQWTASGFPLSHGSIARLTYHFIFLQNQPFCHHPPQPELRNKTVGLVQLSAKPPPRWPVRVDDCHQRSKVIPPVHFLPTSAHCLQSSLCLTPKKTKSTLHH